MNKQSIVLMKKHVGVQGLLSYLEEKGACPYDIEDMSTNTSSNCKDDSKCNSCWLDCLLENGMLNEEQDIITRGELEVVITSIVDDMCTMQDNTNKIVELLLNKGIISEVCVQDMAKK